MKNKILKTFMFFILFSALLITVSFAATVKENVNTKEYSEGAYVIGSTRFDTQQAITASMLYTAGINEYEVYDILGKDIKEADRTLYYYVSEIVGWIKLGEEEPSLTQQEKENLENNLNIFFVNNEVKTVEVKYEGDGKVDETLLSSGVEYDKDKKTFTVPATTLSFKFTETKTVDGKEVKVDKEVVTNVDKNLTAKSEDEIQAPVTVTIPENAAMKVGNEYFEAKDLATAIAASNAENPVTLLEDLKLDKVIELNLEGKSAVLDLNGKVLDSSSVALDETTQKSYALKLTAGELTINNGTIKTKTVDGYRNILNEGATLKVNGVSLTGNYNIDTNSRYSTNAATTTISASELTSDFACTTVWTKGTVNIEKSELISDIYCVSGNGTQCDAVINITDSTLESYTGVGVYMPSTETLNITNSIVTGKSGLEILAGTTTIKNSEIYATGEYIETFAKETGSGPWLEGSAIFMRVQKGYNDGGKLALQIDGDSKVVSKNGDGIRLYECTSSTTEFGPTQLFIKYDADNTIAENGNPINIQQLENTGITFFAFNNHQGIAQEVVNTEEELIAAVNNTMDLKSTNTILNADIELTKDLVITDKVILNLNGHTLSGTENITDIIAVKENGNLTLKNGNVTFDGETAVAVYSKGVLNIEKDVTVSGGLFGVYVVEEGATANIAGTVTITDKGNAVLGSGNSEKGGTIINIESTAKILAPKGTGIYQPQTGITTIKDGAQISGDTAIGIKAGTLDIYSDKLKGGKSIENSKLKPEGSATQETGDIIYVECNDKYDGEVKINIHKEFENDEDSNVIRVFRPVGVENNVLEVKGVYTKANLVEVKDAEENVTATVTTYTK